MKFRVNMKDPDALSTAIKEAVDAEVSAIVGLTAEERIVLREGREELMIDACRKWFEYGEYLEVEIDTEAKTATVVARK